MDPADGATSVVFGPDAEPAGVEVPLILRDGDARPLVEVRIGEDHPTLARIDLGSGGVVRVGVLLAIRAGLPELRHGTRTVVPWLRIGDLLLNDVQAELTTGDELVLGVDALDEVGVAVLVSRGVVRFGPEAAPEGAPGALPDPDDAPFTDVVRLADGRVWTSPAPRPRWTDADEVRLRWVESRASHWSAPEPRATVPEGDPGDLLGRLRWSELAEARFASGDLEGARSADRNLLVAAGDRCEVALAAGARLLRAGDPAGPEALRRARALWERWAALDQGDRIGVREGRRLPAGRLAIEQPDECARASLLLPGSSAAFGDDAWTTARWALDSGSEGALRDALARGAEVPALRIALASIARCTGREELARLQVGALATAADPHPLTSAVWVAEVLGPEALREVSDESLAARVVLGQATPGEVERAEAERPGDATACAAVVVVGARPEALDRADADCLAAGLLIARRRGDASTERDLLDALRVRWPDAWPDDPCRRGGHPGGGRSSPWRSP